MLQLGRRATVARAREDEEAALRDHFDAHMWARLPRVLDPALLLEVQRLLAAAKFEPHVHHNVNPPSIDWIMAPGPAGGLLELAFNDPQVHRVIEAITGCDPIGHFLALVYRMLPDQGHEHQWHNDLILGRMIAISVNLGPDDYQGGVLQLRERSTGTVFATVDNPVPGDAIIFALDPSIDHRVTRVTGGVKTAFAGWFCAGPTYLELFHESHSGARV